MSIFCILGLLPSADRFKSTTPANFDHRTDSDHQDSLPEAALTVPHTTLSLVTWLWLGSLAIALFGDLATSSVLSHAGFLQRYRVIQTAAVLSYALFVAGLCLPSPPVMNHTALPFLILGQGWSLLAGGLLFYSFHQIDPRELSASYLIVSEDKLQEIQGSLTPASEKQVTPAVEIPADETSLLESLAKRLEAQDAIEPDDAMDALLDALDQLLARDVRCILQMSFLDLSHLKKKSWRIVTRIAAECLDQEVDSQQYAVHVENSLVWSTHMEYAFLLLLSTSNHRLTQESAAVIRRCMTCSRIRSLIAIITPRVCRVPRSDVDTLRIVLERLRVREVLVHCADLNVMQGALQELIQEYFCHYEHDHNTFQAHFDAHRVELVRGGVTDIIMPMFVRVGLAAIHPDMPYSWPLVNSVRILATFWSPEASWSSSALELFRETFTVIPHAYILAPNLISASHENFDELSTWAVTACFLQGRAADQYNILHMFSQMILGDWKMGGCIDNDPCQETTNPIHPLKLAKLCLSILLSSMDPLPVPGTRAATLWARLWINVTMALEHYSSSYYVISEDHQIAVDVVEEIRALVGTGCIFDSPEEWAVSYGPEDGAFFPKRLLNALVDILRPEDRPRTVLSPISSRASSPTQTRPATPEQALVEEVPPSPTFLNLYQSRYGTYAPVTRQDVLDSPTITITTSDDALEY